MKSAKLLMILMLLLSIAATLTTSGCRAEGEIDDDGVEGDIDT